MKRVTMIALALVAVLWTTDAATARIYAIKTVNPVVFEGDPEYPSVTNPSVRTSAVATDAGITGPTPIIANDIQQDRSRQYHWWRSLWRWLWPLF